MTRKIPLLSLIASSMAFPESVFGDERANATVARTGDGLTGPLLMAAPM